MFTDPRYSLRALRKRPGFSLVAILMLAVGIGGADAEALLMLVLRQGVRILILGLVPGLTVAAVAANALRSLIAEVQPMNLAL